MRVGGYCLEGKVLVVWWIKKWFYVWLKGMLDIFKLLFLVLILVGDDCLLLVGLIRKSWGYVF